MRRGLISRSHVELPDAALDARLARVRAAMNEAHLDVLLAYTNNTRPAAVSWLTGFVPYWSEALLVLPRAENPVLIVALTFRVKPWIEQTSRVAEIVHTPRIGLEAGRRIAAQKANARVGVVDFDELPTGIADDLREGGRELAVGDASTLFGRVRAKADPTDLALAAKAAHIAEQALAVPRSDEAIGDIISAVEMEARRLGAEEIYVAAAPDLARSRHLQRIEGRCALGRTYALRASVAYKGAWVRVVRTVDRDGTDRATFEEAATRFAQAVASLPSEEGFAGFASWLVEGCRLAQPLDALMGSRIVAPAPPGLGALVVVQAAQILSGRTVLLGAPAVLGAAGEAASLLAAPV